MYAYTWDPETGGLLLNSSPLQFSKEPRPVYWRELDLLGFDKYWDYPHDDSAPIMWAEANNYIYRGCLVAKIIGGSLKSKPKIELIENDYPKGVKLIPVDIDAMVKKNVSILEILTQSTIQNIYNDYTKHKKRIDVFYVAFSGGKDSMVVLDLVQRALPHSSFKVLFGDTQMEFPDTYNAVHQTEIWCKENGIQFLTAKSNLKPSESWLKFGPPATVNRWCCSVHKTAPQILLLRKLSEKQDFKGFAFIGVRRAESAARSEYDEISEGKKHRGQISCNPILDWNSAELFLYIYANKLYINEAYLRGNRRAGCLVCPRAAERNEYIARECYPNQFNSLTSKIEECYSERFLEKSRLDEFMENGGWKARKNGQDLNLPMEYEEISDKKNITLILPAQLTPWKEWIKTIGILQNEESPYKLIHKGELFEFECIERGSEVRITIDAHIGKTHPSFIKVFKNVFRKSANCIRCRVCEADCPFGHLHMDNGVLRIDNSCVHCSQCHKVESGCLVYKSLEKPKALTKMAQKSLNCYSHFAPKREWLDQFFKYREDFKSNHTLGTNMYDFFKRFLRDASLIASADMKFTPFAEVIGRLSLEDENAWALMLCNLVYTPQFNWAVNKLNFGETANVDYLKASLVYDGAKESWVSDVCSCFGRFAALPFARVGYLNAEMNKTKLLSVSRQPYTLIEPRVLLYSLYKYAEACGDFKQFTMSRLYDENIDSDGVSPVRIFGIEKEQMEKMLKGLSQKYPEFIHASFTHDLDTITLKEDKASEDVLSLF